MREDEGRKQKVDEWEARGIRLKGEGRAQRRGKKREGEGWTE